MLLKFYIYCSYVLQFLFINNLIFNTHKKCFAGFYVDIKTLFKFILNIFFLFYEKIKQFMNFFFTHVRNLRMYVLNEHLIDLSFGFLFQEIIFIYTKVCSIKFCCRILRLRKIKQMERMFCKLFPKTRDSSLCSLQLPFTPIEKNLRNLAKLYLLFVISK